MHGRRQARLGLKSKGQKASSQGVKHRSRACLSGCLSDLSCEFRNSVSPGSSTCRTAVYSVYSNRLITGQHRIQHRRWRCGLITKMAHQSLHAGGSQCVDRVISGMCDCVCVSVYGVEGGSVCVRPRSKRNRLSYRHKTWYTYSPWQPLASAKKIRPKDQRLRSHGCKNQTWVRRSI